MRDDLIAWLSFGVPLLVVVGTLVWFLGKPSWDMWRLKSRAAAGDPKAQAAVTRAKELREIVRRAAFGGDDVERRRLLTVGRPARAAIVDVRPLGLQVSSGPMPTQLIEIVLQVEGGGWAPVTVHDAVSEPYLGRLLKGATVPIRVDPSDPQRLVVLWDTI